MTDTKAVPSMGDVVLHKPTQSRYVVRLVQQNPDQAIWLQCENLRGERAWFGGDEVDIVVRDKRAARKETV